ncbi:acyltransferase [Telmatocola sphagniphila]|uniref:Acyltransferase n=1 Tax=Telmatocola sphagniphila TaxID=1123043 RepID=A0A8E6B201_9BACT|nr:acyltransferase [Telmatocola sphagniphila]QVL29909.1 acyltransferase [Telmatocola sphagniphila]
MESKNTAKDRIWFAQLLRGLACLVVVYSHLAWGYWLEHENLKLANLVVPLDPLPEMPPHIDFHMRHSINHMTPGGLGVSTFFLISGFVIPISLEKYRTRGFLLARWFRIFPVFWTTLSINCLALYWYWSVNGNGFPYNLSTILANAGLVAPQLQLRWVDSVSWTLALEVQFYILCAAMYSLGLFRTWKGVLSTAGVLSLLSFSIGSYYNSAFILGNVQYWPLCILGNDLCYLIYMLVGTCFYRFYKQEWSLRTSVLMTLAILGLWYLPTSNHLMQAQHFPATRRTYIASYFCFGFFYLFRGYIPYVRPLNFLANISYPLYLVHPVIGYMILTTALRQGLTAYPAIAIAFISTFLLAVAIHYLVEERFNQLGKRLAERLRPRPTNSKISETETHVVFCQGTIQTPEEKQPLRMS